MLYMPFMKDIEKKKLRCMLHNWNKRFASICFKSMRAFPLEYVQKNLRKEDPRINLEQLLRPHILFCET